MSVTPFLSTIQLRFDHHLAGCWHVRRWDALRKLGGIYHRNTLSHSFQCNTESLKDMLHIIVSELSGRRDALAHLPLMLISDTQIMLLSITQAGGASRTIRQLKQ